MLFCRQKRSGSRCREGEEVRGIEREKTIIRIYCVIKEFIFKEGKNIFSYKND